MEGMEVVAAKGEDASDLASLRVEAMRPSLEAVGRFDPTRARYRFLDSFCERNTWKILLEGELAGFYVYLIRERALYLEHLYIPARYQGRGIASIVIADMKKLAAKNNLPIRLLALRGSRSNMFYLKHGFTVVDEQQYDYVYEWSVSK